jgi:hypothetical protein
MREFETGATRDQDDTKHDFEGYLSPLVLGRYAEYMTRNRHQDDGTIRDGDNWKKGIPMDSYMKSGWRHFFEWWSAYRDGDVCLNNVLEDALCGLMFNVMGFLHEHLKKRGY